MRTGKDRAIDKIWDAVQEAFAAGITPREFVVEAWKSWQQLHRDDLKVSDDSFRKMVHP